MPLSLHPAAVTLVLEKLSLSGEKFICHFSTNTGSILSLLLRKEPDTYTLIIGAPYRQEPEPDLGSFCASVYCQETSPCGVNHLTDKTAPVKGRLRGARR